MFIGRDTELNKLNKLYYTDEFQCCIIYGRRRVGKTRLIQEFIRDKKAIYFASLITSSKQNLLKFKREVIDVFGDDLDIEHNDYIRSLISLGLIENEKPVNENESKRNIYVLKDNLFKFWYRFVPNSLKWIEAGLSESAYEDFIKPNLSDYMGNVFEDICIQYMMRKNGAMELPFMFGNIGRWWGEVNRRQEEIDILAIDGDKAIFGECKWRKENFMNNETNIIDAISKFIFIENPPEKADIIFIPGGSSPELSEHAAYLYKQGFSKLILPSGKFPKHTGFFSGTLSKKDAYNEPYDTEWEFLRSVLIKNGVDKSAILKEDEATYTYENALFSKIVTDRMNLTIKKAIICCKSFHSRRCLMYYQLVYKETDFLLCPVNVKNISKDNWYLSEFGITKVLGELKRCGEQFTDIFKDIYIK